MKSSSIPHRHTKKDFVAETAKALDATVYVRLIAARSSRRENRLYRGKACRGTDGRRRRPTPTDAPRKKKKIISPPHANFPASFLKSDRESERKIVQKKYIKRQDPCNNELKEKVRGNDRVGVVGREGGRTRNLKVQRAARSLSDDTASRIKSVLPG